MKIEKNAETPLYLQIYKNIVNEIINGYLAPEEKLPPRRTLAAKLGVAQQTVENAYQKLVADGYVNAKVGSGYYVSYEKVWMDDKKSSNAFLYNFSTNGVETSKLPFNIWAKLLKNTIKENMNLFQHGDKEGEWCLRKSIRRLLFRTQGIKCDTEQIIIGPGVEDLIRGIFDTVEADSVILMNNYYNYRANATAIDSGKPVAYIRTEVDGINTDMLNKYSKGYLYQKPIHDLPTAISVDEDKKRKICEWAENEKYIIEDSTENDYIYGKRQKTLWETADGKNVIFLGDFSKTIAPSMKIGFMVAPYSFIEKWFDKKRYYSNRVSRVEQVTLSKFIDNRYYEKHVGYMCDIYKEKCNVLKKCLEQSSFADKYEIWGDDVGMYFNIWFDTDVSENELVSAFRKQGVKISAISTAVFDKTNSVYRPNTFNLGFGELKISEIQRGVELMSIAWNKLHT